ncbi:2-amino-4-hydroxy-6-hydroxymethyldihydropteridine diphosphokinase [candidate division KSB1 bacterium]|nr:2-amino-4-hydroxy-6-hydroxymethyldihydropteridine diphosphokinase [candidate division KSB1 bacterium]
MKPNPHQNTAVIGVGSNIDPEKNIEHARTALVHTHQLIAESRFTQTEPIGYADQSPFTNGVWLIKTEMDKNKLTEWLHDLEGQLERVRTENKYGPRTIDLDVVVWNGQIVDSNVYERDYLKQAVLEVLPDLVDQFDVLK